MDILTCKEKGEGREGERGIWLLFVLKERGGRGRGLEKGDGVRGVLWGGSIGGGGRLDLGYGDDDEGEDMEWIWMGSVSSECSSCECDCCV